MFVQIKEYPNYFINENGDVKSTYVSKMLSPRRAGRGYFCYQLRNDNHTKNKYVHRLVAETFIPNPHNLPQVDHIDGDKSNNNITNLRWISNYENVKAYGFEKCTQGSIDAVGVGVIAMKDDIRLEFRTKSELLRHFGYETNRTRVKMNEVYSRGKMKGFTVLYL